MTSLERWTAAVKLQHDTAAQLDACDDDQQFADLVNGARIELFAAAHGGPDGLVLAEWPDAYNVIRNAELRAVHRFRRRAALATVETVRAECCELVERGLAAEARRSA